MSGAETVSVGSAIAAAGFLMTVGVNLVVVTRMFTRVQAGVEELRRVVLNGLTHSVTAIREDVAVLKKQSESLEQAAVHTERIAEDVSALKATCAERGRAGGC